MNSTWNRALLFHILNATQYEPRDRRFYYAVLTALALLVAAVLMVVFIF